MGFYGHNRNSGIPYLSTYKEAFDKYQNTKPIRGRKEDERPLGHRNNIDSFKIRLNADDGVECVLWGTPVVTFNVDGTIRIKNYSYNTISTCNFLSDVLRNVSACLHDHKIHVYFTQYMQGRNDLEGFVLDNKEGLHVTYDVPNNCYTLLNAKHNKVHYIKRKQSNDSLKKYKGFEKYLLGNVKVRGGVFAEDEYKEVFGTTEKLYYTDDYGKKHFNTVTKEFNVSSLSNLGNPKAVEALFNLIESEEAMDNNKAVMMLATVSKHSYYSEKVNESQVLHALKKCVLARHKMDCFEEVELPLGMYKKDRYGYLFDFDVSKDQST